MTSISKNVFIDKLDDIVNKYNNTYHRTIKTKPVDVKSNTYSDSSKEISNKDHLDHRPNRSLTHQPTNTIITDPMPK